MLTDIEIWEKVKSLEGKTIYTLTHHDENYIKLVENSSSDNDRVIIRDRDTTPIKRDIIAAYSSLHKQGQLERKKDLDWLATADKQTSSIVFSLIAEIAKEEIEIIDKKKVILKLKK